MSPLNFAQASNVASSLTVLDEFCLEVRAILDDRYNRHLLQYENLPDKAEQRKIMGVLDELVAELRLTSSVLGVEVSPVDVQKKIRHQAALLIAGLGDLRPKALNRFGETPVGMEEAIDGAVSRIIALLNRLVGA